MQSAIRSQQTGGAGEAGRARAEENAEIERYMRELDDAIARMDRELESGNYPDDECAFSAQSARARLLISGPLIWQAHSIKRLLHSLSLSLSLSLSVSHSRTVSLSLCLSAPLHLCPSVSLCAGILSGVVCWAISPKKWVT